LLEEHDGQKKILDTINGFLEERGGTIVDATIIRRRTARKAVIRRCILRRRGKEWHFGLKAHIGVDAVSGMTHTVAVTAANVGDIEKAAELIRKDDEVAYGDSGYTGLEKREEIPGNEKPSGIVFQIKRGRYGGKTAVAVNPKPVEGVAEDRRAGARSLWDLA
jgi:IS5 family transposase